MTMSWDTPCFRKSSGDARKVWAKRLTDSKTNDYVWFQSCVILQYIITFKADIVDPIDLLVSKVLQVWLNFTQITPYFGGPVSPDTPVSGKAAEIQNLFAPIGRFQSCVLYTYQPTRFCFLAKHFTFKLMPFLFWAKGCGWHHYGYSLGRSDIGVK